MDNTLGNDTPDDGNNVNNDNNHDSDNDNDYNEMSRNGMGFILGSLC